MKKLESDYNPLAKILEVIDNHDDLLTVNLVAKLDELFKLGGVQTESMEETIAMLQILEEQGLISIEEIETNNKIYFKVKNKYGK